MNLDLDRITTHLTAATRSNELAAQIRGRLHAIEQELLNDESFVAALDLISAGVGQAAGRRLVVPELAPALGESFRMGLMLGVEICDDAASTWDLD